MKHILTILLMPFFGYSQNDTIIGNLKSVQETVIYLDSLYQQPRLFQSDGDYGHSGFRNPKVAMIQMTSSWYGSYFTRFASYLKEYNSSRQLTSEIWYYKNGDEYSRYNYKYDKLNNLIEEKEIDIENQSYYCHRHFFDDYNNKKRSSIFYWSDDPTFYGYKYYVYDEKNNNTFFRRYSEDGSMGGRRYTYTKNGKVETEYELTLLKKIDLGNGSTSFIRDSIEKQILRYKHTFDKNENLVKKQYYNEGIVSGEDNFKYDTSGKLLEENLAHGGTFLYEYNKKGLLSKKTYLYKSPDILSEWTKYYYSKDDHLIKIEMNEEGKEYEVEFQYVFDKFRNWIEQSKSVNGKRLYLRRRLIEYY